MGNDGIKSPIPANLAPATTPAPQVPETGDRVRVATGNIWKTDADRDVEYVEGQVTGTCKLEGYFSTTDGVTVTFDTVTRGYSKQPLTGERLKFWAEPNRCVAKDEAKVITPEAK
jgi:hypothetical protein